MKSSEGKHYLALDHIRAVAAFFVFTWHFVHVNNLHLTPVSIFPLSLLTEGHTGVALFMTLSGYLFAKLLNGRRVNYLSFFWNRFLRLFPLLFLVVLIVGLRDLASISEWVSYARKIVLGSIYPTLPNGGWSITVEAHFYVLLPLLLALKKRSVYWLVGVLLMALIGRLAYFILQGEAQSLAYWTIAGRIDQFLLGILAFHIRDRVASRHLLACVVAVLFLLFFWWFEASGGFYEFSGYPSASLIWVIFPAIEGLAYAILIAWYDNSFTHPPGRYSIFFAKIGEYSYSIYLLHFFFYAAIAGAIDRHVLSLDNVYLALGFAPIGFLIMIPMSYMSYRFIELPFLRYRRSYLHPNE